jgi:hypothetical protein
MTADPADRDPVLMAVADGLTRYDLTSRYSEVSGYIVHRVEASDDGEWVRLNDVYAALLSERHRAEEAMRERVIADLSAHIEKHEAGLKLKPFDWPAVEERIMALDAARSRVANLPLTPEPTHER